MEKRRFMKDNEGYSLVELIIVLAIVVVMVSASTLTITVIHSAKAKEAASTFEDALAGAQQNAKGKMCIVSGTEQPDYKYALAVYKNGKTFYVKKGYYKGNNLDMNLSSSYEFPDSDNVGSGKGQSFSSYVDVKFRDGSGTEVAIGDISNAVYIIYDKQGRCIHGDGTFLFYRNSTGALISTVTLNKNGSHTSN